MTSAPAHPAAGQAGPRRLSNSLDIDTRAAEKMRRGSLAARAITVFIETSRFDRDNRYSNSAPVEMIYPSDSTQELLHHAGEALSRIYREGYAYRRAGVLFTGLVPAEQLTGRLFDNETLEKFRRIMPVVDMINKKYGKDTVRWARAKPNGRWKTRSARSSPHYTTRLTDVPILI